MRKGFTLVELLVSITLFSIIVAIAVGGFSNALHTQRQVAALLSVQSNASLALEQIAREVRTGHLFCHDLSGVVTCSGGAMCGGPGVQWDCDTLNFDTAEGENVTYALDPAGSGAIIRTDNGSSSVLTSNNVKIDYLGFTLFGNQEGDNWPPRITIAVQASPSSTDPGIASDTVNLQTTVSARAFDCTPSGSC